MPRVGGEKKGCRWVPLASALIRTYVRVHGPPPSTGTDASSIAMLQPGSKALSREDARPLIAEVQDLERRMRALREALTGVLADRGG